MNKLYLIWCLCVGTVLTATAQSYHFKKGVSIRDKEQRDYYKMVDWDDSQYEQFGHWEESLSGSVHDFMNWRAIFPAGFDVNDTVKYPMIVLLHGAGESGRKCTFPYDFHYDPSDPEYDNNGHHLYWGGEEHRDAVNRPATHSRSFPGIVIFPQVSYNGAWKGDNITKTARIVEHMIATYDVDPYRVYLQGLSSGGEGTWDVATHRPDLFAAVLPMAGVGKSKDASTDSLVTTPLWMFQGGKDTNPSPEWASEWIDALKDKGGKPRYTVYPNNGHNVWVRAYGESDFFSWMLEQNKKEVFYFGDLTECVTTNNTQKLGFSAGFLGYQWLHNGDTLSGATDRYYTATEGGKYEVLFLQPIDSQWVKSEPIELPGANSNPPVLAANSSVTLPVSNNTSEWNETLKLTATPGFPSYDWYLDGSFITNTSEPELMLNDSSGLEFTSSDAGVYEVRIPQYGACGGSSSESTITVTYTNPQPTSNPPSGLTATALSSSEIRLDWTDTGYEIYYEIWQQRAHTLDIINGTGYLGEDFYYRGKVDANITTFTADDLRPDADYTFVVRAIRPNEAGATASDAVDASTGNDTQAPSKPSSFTTKMVKEDAIEISWEPADDNDVVVKYELYDAEIKIADILSDTLDGNPADGSPAPPTSYVVTNLSPATSHTLKIRAVDYQGNRSPFSEIISISTPGGNGVLYTYYEQGFWPEPMATFFETDPAPVTSAQTSNFDVDVAERKNRYVVAYDALLEIKAAGNYTFYTKSNDGSMLYINDQEVVDNDGTHKSRIRRGVHRFTKPGLYPIRVVFNKYHTMYTGDAELVVKYQQGVPNDQDQNKHDDGYDSAYVIPDSRLYLSDKMADPLSAKPVSANTLNRLILFPNPTKATIRLQADNSNFQQAMTYEIYHLSQGQEVMSGEVQFVNGQSEINLMQLRRGTYLIHIGDKKMRFVKN
ncbi:fibronectin type III domain-containing protein [Marinoscillum furvescens]|nr:PA14 domain-containing protein [Marinoscillum furvescens]